MSRRPGALAVAGAAAAGTRLVLMLHPALGLWRDRQTGPSAVAGCKTQALASQELGQATKKQTFQTCIYFTLYFSQGCSPPEQLIISQALRFLALEKAYVQTDVCHETKRIPASL